MKWIDAQNLLPEDQQQVIVYYNERHELAIYEKGKNNFRLRNNTFLPVKENIKIFWAQLIGPEVGHKKYG
jgi:hypothetical protein